MSEPCFTETQIRAVMSKHGVATDGSCLCSWGPGADHGQELTADHLIDKLKETHV